MTGINNPDPVSLRVIARSATTKQSLHCEIASPPARNDRLVTPPNPSLLSSTEGRAGFTLLEVLIAVAITAVIIAALYSTFFLSRRAVDAVDDSLVKLQETRAVLDVMKREIESAVFAREKPYTLFKLDDRDFYGKQASQLVVTSFAPLLPGVSKITYTVEENDGKLTLSKKIDAAYGKPVETRSFALMEDIDSFTVEAGYNGKWVKTWDSTASGGMPEQIRISVKIRTKKEESPFTVSEIALPRTGTRL